MEAIEPLRRAIALQPKVTGPLYSLSLAYRRLGQIEEADRLRQQVSRLRRKSTNSPRREAEEGDPGDE